MAQLTEATAAQPWLPPLLWARLTGRLPRLAPRSAQQVVWAVSGCLFGLAAAETFRWAAAPMVVAGLFVGLLAWLGRGLGTVLVAACVTLGALGIALRTSMVAFPAEAWSMEWLWPLGVLTLVGAVVLARRCGIADWVEAWLASAVLELAAGGGSLALAVLCAHRIGSASASAILLSSEDNAAWLQTVGVLRNAHGITTDATPQVSLFGPVANTYLAFTREASGGLFVHPLSSGRTATVVLSAHVLLIVAGPVVAALMARRTLRYGRPLLTLVCWAGVATVIVTYAFITPDHGFLTTGLAIMIVLTAACLLPGGSPDIGHRAGLARWGAAALVLYAAGSSWIPMAPLAGAALVGWWLAIAWPALKNGPWRRLATALLLAVPTALAGWALLLQYRDVVDPIGGGNGLFESTGGTPAATTTMTVIAAVLVGAVWLSYRGPDAAIGLPTFVLPLAGLVAYAAVALVTEGYLTREPPHYGTIKLLYVVVGLAAALGLADLLASPLLGRLRIDAAIFVVAATMFALAVEQGPLTAAAVGHWPKPQLPTIWVKQVNREVPGKARVLCLGLTPAPDTSQPSLDAYLCDRWAAGLQGKDDDPAADWRSVQLGRLPVSRAVAWLRAAHDLPWTIVVIGPLSKLHDPKAWYAPIVAQPGLKFISSGF